MSQAPNRVDDVLEAFRTALLAGNASELATLYEEDAVYYVPALGIAAKGRAEIRARWEETFTAWRAVSFEVEDHQLDVHGDLASSWLRASMTVEWHEDGRQEVIPVRAADVFHRGADGAWRYAVDHA
jgi:uncharacterized protein (TIGR02246 family)